MDGQFLIIMAGIFLILSKISFCNGEMGQVAFFATAGVINAVCGAISLWQQGVF